MNIRLRFKPRDLWIGVFWRTVEGSVIWGRWREVYICILPMLPICLRWRLPLNLESRWPELGAQR